MADRVAGDQTDNVVGRTSAYCATPTTNGCGCPVRYFCCASVSLSYPFALGRILFMLLYSYCFVLSSQGGMLSLFLLFCIIMIIIFIIIILLLNFVVPFVFLCQSMWIASFCMYMSYPVQWRVIAWSTLLNAVQCTK